MSENPVISYENVHTHIKSCKYLQPCRYCKVVCCNKMRCRILLMKDYETLQNQYFQIQEQLYIQKEKDHDIKYKSELASLIFAGLI